MSNEEIKIRDAACEKCSRFSHCNNNSLVCITKFKKLEEQLLHTTAEYEELSTAFQQSEFYKFLLDGCELNFPIVARYQQALDEIKNVWENDEDGDYDFIKREILNIINKAKDGE